MGGYHCGWGEGCGCDGAAVCIMPHLAGHWVIRARLQYIQWHLLRGGLLSLARSQAKFPF